MDLNVVKRLNEFLQNEKMSISAFARAIGMSVTAISQARNNSYQGDNETLANKILKYIESYSRQAKKEVKEGFKESKDAKMAAFIINEAIAERETALIYGAPGTGKTTILKEFAKKTPNAVLIEATAHTNAQALLNALINFLKLEIKGSLDYKLREVAKFLKNNDKIILIDEAEHLPLRALEDLRRLQDFSNVPLILCGTGQLLRNLMGKNERLSQLFSRIGNKWIMEGLSPKECNAFFGNGFYEWTKGNFRSSTKLYKKAERLAELNGCEINDEIIKQASQMVILG